MEIHCGTFRQWNIYYSLGTRAVILKIWSLKCVSNVDSWSQPKLTAAETLGGGGQQGVV